jgi:hypothetical protein
MTVIMALLFVPTSCNSTFLVSTCLYNQHSQAFFLRSWKRLVLCVSLWLSFLHISPVPHQPKHFSPCALPDYSFLFSFSYFSFSHFLVQPWTKNATFPMFSLLCAQTKYVHIHFSLIFVFPSN